MSTVTCVKAVCLGALLYGLCYAANFATRAAELGVHPYAFVVYDVPVIAITVVAGLSMLYRRAARPAVLCIATYIAYTAAAGMLPAVISNAPSLFNQVRYDLPSFLAAAALAVWACGSERRLIQGWGSLGGVLLAYGVMCAGSWLAGMLVYDGAGLLACVTEPTAWPSAVAQYLAPLMLALSYTAAGLSLTKGPPARAWRFRAIGLFAIAMPVLPAVITQYMGFTALTLVGAFICLLAPSIVAASLLALGEYYGWRLAGSEGTCVECGYNLTGNVTGRCPECGEVAPVVPALKSG